MNRFALIAAVLMICVIGYFQLRPSGVSELPSEAVEQPMVAAAPSEPSKAITTDLKEKNVNSPIKAEVKNTRAEEIRSAIKTALAALYAGEKSFHSEFGRFSTDLRSLGWFPEENIFKYKLGFLNSFDPENLPDTEEPRFLDTDAYLLNERGNGDQPYSYDEKTKDISLMSLQGYCKHRCTASQYYFEIIAAANLDNDPTLDVWVMSAEKILINVSDDLKE